MWLDADPKFRMMEYLKRVSLKRTAESFTFAFAGRTPGRVQELRDREFAGTIWEEPVSGVALGGEGVMMLAVAGFGCLWKYSIDLCRVVFSVTGARNSWSNAAMACLKGISSFLHALALSNFVSHRGQSSDLKSCTRRHQSRHHQRNPLWGHFWTRPRHQ